jgi:hypothetical protein
MTSSAIRATIASAGHQGSQPFSGAFHQGDQRFPSPRQPAPGRRLGVVSAALWEKTAMTTEEQVDAGLLADIERHGSLWTEWDRIVAECGEDDARIPALSDETTELAKRIVMTPAHTAEGRDGKIRVVKLEELESWDDLGLIEAILDLDAARIAAAA